MTDYSLNTRQYYTFSLNLYTYSLYLIIIDSYICSWEFLSQFIINSYVFGCGIHIFAPSLKTLELSKPSVVLEFQLITTAANHILAPSLGIQSFNFRISANHSQNLHPRVPIVVTTNNLCSTNFSWSFPCFLTCFHIIIPRLKSHGRMCVLLRKKDVWVLDGYITLRGFMLSVDLAIIH